MVVLGHRRSLRDRRHRGHCEWGSKKIWRSGLDRHINHGGVQPLIGGTKLRTTVPTTTTTAPTTTTTTTTLPPTTTTTSTPSAVVPGCRRNRKIDPELALRLKMRSLQAGFKVEMVPTSSPSCYFAHRRLTGHRERRMEDNGEIIGQDPDAGGTGCTTGKRGVDRCTSAMVSLRDLPSAGDNESPLLSATLS